MKKHKNKDLFYFESLFIKIMDIKQFLLQKKSFILVSFIQILSLYYSISSYKNSKNRIQIIEIVKESKKFNICANKEDKYMNIVNLDSCSSYCKEEVGGLTGSDYRHCIKNCCNKS